MHKFIGASIIRCKRKSYENHIKVLTQYVNLFLFCRLLRIKNQIVLYEIGKLHTHVLHIKSKYLISIYSRNISILKMENRKNYPKSR